LQLRPGGHGASHHRGNLVELAAIVDGADLRCRVARLPEWNPAGRVRQLGHELRMYRALDQQARSGHAALPRTTEYRGLRPKNGTGLVGIAEHDVRGLAAQFQHAWHDAACSGGGPAAHRGRHGPQLRLCRAGCCHRGIHHGWASVLELQYDAAIGWVDQLQRGTAARKHVSCHQTADGTAGQQAGQQRRETGCGIGQKGSVGHQLASLAMR
jgi:hypothetical protein